MSQALIDQLQLGFSSAAGVLLPWGCSLEEATAYTAELGGKPAENHLLYLDQEEQLSYLGGERISCVARFGRTGLQALYSRALNIAEYDKLDGHWSNLLGSPYREHHTGTWIIRGGPMPIKGNRLVWQLGLARLEVRYGVPYEASCWLLERQEVASWERPGNQTIRHNIADV